MGHAKVCCNKTDINQTLDPSCADLYDLCPRFDFPLVGPITKRHLNGAEHYQITRIMINAKQQIVNLEQLLNAAKNKDNAGFNDAKDKLESQAKH